MSEQVIFLNMFPDYEPPENLQQVLSQAAICAADIDPATRKVEVAIYSEDYIPGRLLEQVQKEIATAYGLYSLEIAATHPASQIVKMEPEELMGLFIAQNSMCRGSLAGARWEWEGETLHIYLKANGKDMLM